MQSHFICFKLPPRKIEPNGTIVSDSVPPVIAGQEISPGIADLRNMQLTHSVRNVFPKSGIVGKRVRRFINPVIDINELAKSLNLTNSALTMHIQKLSDCGLIRVRLSSMLRGTQKLCSLTEDKLLIELVDKMSSESFYETELNVGQYTEYSVNPTCGLANMTQLTGELDNPQAFSYPERFTACVVWFTDGRLTYRFPNKLLAYQTPKELQLSFEIAGEAPGAVENYPSEIFFSINGVPTGVYHCPGEFFERKGRYTPDWWFTNFGQYGRIKILTINQEGTFLDGMPVSETTLDDLHLDQHENIAFTLDCRKEEGLEENGGITLFGKGYGDYDQGIKLRLVYTQDNIPRGEV